MHRIVSGELKRKANTKSNPFVFVFQAYISCALGVHRVGYVMICFGVVNAGCSLLFGSLMKFVGRQPLMALGAIVHASLVVVLLMWKPHPDNPYVFYSVSGLWGVGDAVWQTQVNGKCLLHYTHMLEMSNVTVKNCEVTAGKEIARSNKRSE